jgi:leucyl aminopeptidase
VAHADAGRLREADRKPDRRHEEHRRPSGRFDHRGLFLQKFVNGVPWAHLDIASVAWKKPSTDPTVPDGAVGFGVRLLNRLVADAYEG